MYTTPQQHFMFEGEVYEMRARGGNSDIYHYDTKTRMYSHQHLIAFELEPKLPSSLNPKLE